MTDQYLGEVRLFAGNFAPQGWALCNGQLMAISQNTALFSLLGTSYGGDGRSTFGLPDFRDSAPMHAGGSGAGPGLTAHDVGERGGTAAVTVTIPQLPAHTHTVLTSALPGSVVAQSAASLGANALEYGPSSNMAVMSDNAGGGQPHENRQPYLGLTFIIALQGIFPPRP